MEIRNTLLMRCLREKNEKYWHKVLELRETIEDWLGYIPQTFPHYTRHTVKHSDEIVIQLSNLLYADDELKNPSADLSAAEIYVLLCAAYLHDAGMVASDREKQKILSTKEWKDWVCRPNAGAARYEDVEKLRSNAAIKDPAVRNFLADVQIRFLIAEFIRIRHHLRSAEVIRQHDVGLNNFCFGNPALIETISDVCVAHGLSFEQLDDPSRYPEVRDIDGDRVNVRFMAILLRIGDLLDLSHDRACPLLLNAASPLPADSLAHWSQYLRITHRHTSPDKIEIAARCMSQDEHRLLRDWCQWLVDEIRKSSLTMSRARRHSQWRPPVASFREEDNSILIEPASDANYIFSNWKIELDRDQVFDRLIYNLYDHGYAYLKELIQNSLDATRCKMYMDLKAANIDGPPFPTKIAASIRNQYPLVIRIEDIEQMNEMSGLIEVRQLLSIDDLGIGMDKPIVERYFLQIGRSYYVSNEFRQQYNFVPTSKFGVGFLSVFGVSDEIVVDTLKSGGSGLKLKLTGPKNYLLAEKSSRSEAGTSIRILLRQPVDAREIYEYVKRLCQKVEFPIRMELYGERYEITEDDETEYCKTVPCVGAENRRFEIKSFPINTKGYEGNFYVFSYVSEEGESWAHHLWAKNTYVDSSPFAEVPELPEGMVCLNGLLTESSMSPDNYSVRVDYRGQNADVTMSRNRLYRSTFDGQPEVAAEVEKIVDAHMATTPRAKGPNGWKYIHRLIDIYEMPSFCEKASAGVPIWNGLTRKSSSMGEVEGFTSLCIRALVCDNGKALHGVASSDSLGRWIDIIDVAAMSKMVRSRLFDGLALTKILVKDEFETRFFWERKEVSESDFLSRGYEKVWLAEFEGTNDFGVSFSSTGKGTADQIAFNKNHYFVIWLISVKDACEGRLYGLKPESFRRLLKFAADVVRYRMLGREELLAYLKAWRETPGLPPEFCPPKVDFDRLGKMRSH